MDSHLSCKRTRFQCEWSKYAYSYRTGVFTNVGCVTPRKPDLEVVWYVETIVTIVTLDKPNTTNDEMVQKHFKETVKFKEG